MNGRAILTAALLLIPVPVFGQSLQPGWIADACTGCKVWDRDPQPNLSVTWSGTCRGGFADGSGILQWFNDGKLVEHEEGENPGWQTEWPRRGYVDQRRPLRWRIRGMAWRTATACKRGPVATATMANGRMTKNGHGVATSASGDRYDGEWRDDKRNG